MSLAPKSRSGGSLLERAAEVYDFGAALMRRVADGEIDEEQAIALALQHYRG